MDILNDVNLTLKDALNEMQKMEVGSEEYLRAAKAVETLTQSVLEDKKLRDELEGASYEKKMEFIKLIVDILKWIGRGLSVAGLTVLVLKFEESGLLRSKVWAWIPKLWISSNL